MARHQYLAVQARDAIARADRDEARRAARALAEVQLTAANAEYGEQLAAMHAAAAQVAAADDLPAAATAFGVVAGTCASCHARMTGPTVLQVPRPPPATAAVEPRMRRHAWAVEQLWNGLVFNSEPPWRAGAEVLRDPLLTSEELVPQKTPGPVVEVMASSVQSAGHRATAASDPAVRARIYGELLGTCAGCHERTGGGAFAAPTYPLAETR